MPVFSLLLPSWRILPAWAGAKAATPATPQAVIAPQLPPPGHTMPPEIVETPVRAASLATPVPATEARPQPQPVGAIRDAVPTLVNLPEPAGNGPGFARVLPGLIVWAYLAGTIILLLRRALAAVLLWHVVRHAKAACGGAFRRVLDRCMERIGVRRRPVLLLGEPGCMPMTWGTLWPSIFLPGEATDWTEDRLHIVLLHELGHIRRRDCLSQWLADFAAAMQWFNPLVHLAGRRMRIEREIACDDLVLSLGNRSSEYASHLLQVAAAATRGRLTAAAISMARPGSLEARIRGILDVSRSRRSPGRVAITVLVGLLLGVALPLAMLRGRGGRAQAADPAPAMDAFFELTVVEAASKKPIENATVKFKWGDKVATSRTDAKGRCRLGLPSKGLKSFTVNVMYDGFVPVAADWPEISAADPLPEEYMIALEQATTLGGIVRNEDGQPIEGVTVSFLCSDRDHDKRPRVSIWELTATTDREGRWSATLFPAGRFSVSIRLSHPEHDSGDGYGAAPASLEDLRKGTAEMRLNKGVALEGMVSDLAGQPIRGASVALGSDRFLSYYPMPKTGMTGRFSFGNVRTGEAVMTVTAPGYAPELLRISVHKEMKPVEVKLGPGQVFKGRVVDIDGKPVAGCMVMVDAWRGSRNLNWSVSTDVSGRFFWDGAPADEMSIDAGKEGFIYVRDTVMKAGEAEHVITLQRPMVVRGSVTDAETGRPIDNFRVIPGIVFRPNSDDEPSFDRDHADTRGHGGKYERTFTEMHAGVAVRIEADGYQPATSPNYLKRDGKETFTFDARLRRSSGLAGVIVSREGNPVEGAEVVLCSSRLRAYIRNGHNENGGFQTVMVLTNKGGQFTLPSPQENGWGIVALHDSGMGIVENGSPAAIAQIKLQPWAVVKGTAKIGSRPAGGRTIGLDPDYAYPHWPSLVFFDYSARTNNEGQFRFERVPPGKLRVFRLISREIGGGSIKCSAAASTEIEVKGGQTLEVGIGGGGRAVIGRLEMPRAFPRDAVLGDSSIRFKKPPLPRFDGANVTRAQVAAAMAQYEESAEYQAYMRWNSSTALEMQADGVSFRMEDVEPGTYVLRGSFIRPGVRHPAMDEPMATMQKEFTVEPIPGGQSDEPLDLGKVEVRFSKLVEVGDMAPDFELMNLDGRMVKLSELHGRHVLLSFGSSGYPEMAQEVPILKRVHDTFGKDNRFAVISISFDHSFATTGEFVQKNDVRWNYISVGDGMLSIPDGFDGDRNEESTRSRARACLIGPDGKVIAINLRGEDIEKVVAGEMKK
ncbi:MAG: M56 family metallopeptidase [Tepidisphaerales bacterium]